MAIFSSRKRKQTDEAGLNSQHFSQSTIENLKYYVYLLVDPRTNKPFYVGKGHTKRIDAHVREMVDDTNEEDDSKKQRKIREIGLENVKHVVLRHGLSEKEAFEVESVAIDALGLDNLTNEVLGHHAAGNEPMTREEIEILYKAEDATFDEPVLLININQKFKPGMSQDEMYEATRISWKVKIEKARECKVICSVYKGIIREVFVPEKWDYDPEREGRKYFEGRVAPDEIRDKYLYKSVVDRFKGTQNPIKYEG